MRFCRGSWAFAEVQKWPIDSTGKDLSVIKNQTDGPVVSIRARKPRGFYGCFGIRIRTRGTAHFAGLCGIAREKRYGPGALTRRDSIGARRFPITIAPMSSCKRVSSRNQETYAFFGAATDPSRSRKYWMPVREDWRHFARETWPAWFICSEERRDVSCFPSMSIARVPDACDPDFGRKLVNCWSKKKRDLAPEQNMAKRNPDSRHQPEA